MTQPETAAAARIRTYLRLLPNARTLGGEIAYSEEFRSEDWPRNCYAPTREDVESLLAASSAGVAPDTEQPTPSRRAGLRDEIAAALEAADYRMDMRRGDLADAVLSVLPASVDRATVLREAADAIDAETRQAKADEVLEPDRFRPCRDASAQLRRMAAESVPADAGPAGDETERVVAYRSPGTRKPYCVTCARQETDWQPITLAELQGGARCNFCGGSVLAVAAQTLGAVIARYADEQPAGGAPQPKETDGDRVVAYRPALPGALSIYCTRHTDELGDGVMPLTSDDLPDGGVCAACHVDVLIPQPKEA